MLVGMHDLFIYQDRVTSQNYELVIDSSATGFNQSFFVPNYTISKILRSSLIYLAPACQRDFFSKRVKRIIELMDFVYLSINYKFLNTKFLTEHDYTTNKTKHYFF